MAIRIRRAAEAMVPAAAVLLLLAASGIVLPSPTRALLPVAVGAPELSAWLLVLAVGVAAAASAVASPLSRRITFGTAAAAFALAVIPLWQSRSIGGRFDAALRAAFPDESLDRRGGAVPLGRDGIDARELFGGLRLDTSGVGISDASFSADDGTRLAVRVYRPVQPSGRIVVQIYGGAWQRGAPADDPSMATYLASLGYVVFAIDYRHAPRWRWPTQSADVLSAMAWVVEHAREFGGDASRVAMLGRSAGGHLALLAAYGGRLRVRGVISLYGPSDLTRGYRERPWPDPIGVRGVLAAFMGGDPGTLPQPYRDASPVSYASARQPPTLQIVGLRDHIVLPRFARDLDTRLRAAGNRSVLVELPWAEHAFDAIPFGPGGQLARYATERFLDACFTSQ